LLKCSQALAKAWKTFQQRLPLEQQGILHDAPPKLSTLFNAVKAASNKWEAERDESRWGKTKALFAKLARSADDHSQLLAMVPNNDKYFSLITGSLSAITDATLRHEELAVALSESLEQLCEDIAHWREQVLVHAKVPSMQGYVRELYVLVFEFLTGIFTKWSASGFSRFARAFDKNTADKLFKSKKLKIERLTMKMDRAATLDTEAKISAMEDHLSNLQKGISEEYMEQLILRLGGRVQRMLQEHEFRKQPQLQITPAATIKPQGSTATMEAPSYHENVGVDVLAAIPNLEELFAVPLRSMTGLAGRASRLRIESRVVTKLRDWISGKTVSILWIEGPAHVPKPSQNTLTAVALVATLTEDNPTVCYFCGSTDLATGSLLQQLLDTLIAQTSTFLPSRVSCSMDLSPERISNSMSSQAPMSDRISLFKDIQKLVRRPVFYIIDGLQAVEDRSDRSHSRDLQELLQLLCAGHEGSDTVKAANKVCFATDGYVDALARQVGITNIEKVTFDVECGELATEEEMLSL
jgi:hypothetical protein